MAFVKKDGSKKSYRKPDDRFAPKPSYKPFGKPDTKSFEKPFDKADAKPFGKPTAKAFNRPDNRSDSRPFGKPFAGPTERREYPAKPGFDAHDRLLKEINRKLAILCEAVEELRNAARKK